MIRPVSHFDVVIAGARAAGASTALLLARAGARVLVVDPTARGSDTLSTHALMRAGVVQLDRWGLLDRIRAEGTPRIGQTTFYYQGGPAITVPIKQRGDVDGLYAPRRTVLDRVLVEAAEEAGAEFWHGAAVADLIGDGDRVRGAWVRTPSGEKAVSCDLLIGADGARSKVARLVEAPAKNWGSYRATSIYGHFPMRGPVEYAWHFGPDLSMGTIPTNDGEMCVFASVPPHRFFAERGRGVRRLFEEIIRALSPDLLDAVSDQSIRVRAFAGIHGFIRSSVGPGWALVGDAGYFKDPATAHGITDALRDAELLTRAVLTGGEVAMRGYQRDRDSLARPMMDVSDRIASYAWTMEQLQELHHELSSTMKEELALIDGWGDAGSAAATDGAPSERRVQTPATT